MADNKELPEPWFTAIQDAGFLGPNGEPSLRKLAEAIDVHPSTVSRTIRGVNARGARPELIKKMAKALRQPEKDVASWAGETWEEGLKPYEAPDGAETLTLRQRESVDRVIRAFVEVNRRQRTRRALNSQLVMHLSKRAGIEKSQIAEWIAEVEER